LFTLNEIDLVSLTPIVNTDLYEDHGEWEITGSSATEVKRLVNPRHAWFVSEDGPLNVRTIYPIVNLTHLILNSGHSISHTGIWWL
jgi:hypothetical protein